MPTRQEIEQYKIVSTDDESNEISVPNDGADHTVLQFFTPPGLRGWISFFGQAWDAGMDTFVDYTLKVNGSIPPAGGTFVSAAQRTKNPYNKNKVQIAAPNEIEMELARYIPVQGGSLIEVIANQAAGGVTGNFVGRVIIKYTDPLEDKRP